MVGEVPNQSVPPATRKPPARARERKPRGRGLRTRTGCITCRKRHLKCNEVKPICSPCERSNQICIYASNTSTPDSTLSSSATSAKTSAAYPARNSTYRSGPSTGPVTGTSVREGSCEFLDNATHPQWQYNQLERDRTHHHNPPVWTPITEDGGTKLSPKLLQWTSLADGIDIKQWETSNLVWTPAAEDQHSCQLSTASPSAVSEALSFNGHYIQSAIPRTVTSHGMYTQASPGELAIASKPSSEPETSSAIARWFQLLANDAEFDQSALLHSVDDSLQVPNAKRESPGPHDLPRAQHLFNNNSGYSSPSSKSIGLKTPRSESARIQSAHAVNSEKQMWQSAESLTLQPREFVLFDNFVTNIGNWMDLFDPMKQFSTFVPHLAMHNVGLLNAILALSERHLSLSPARDASRTHERRDSVQYYYEALHYVQKAMQYETYNTSVELLATCLIISAYEMLDGSKRDWERHLQGVYWIQKSQVIHGDSTGLKQTVWWAWLCQDVWAAFRERRKPFSMWKSNRNYSDMNAYEMATRSVYLLSQVVYYCSAEEVAKGNSHVKARIDQADALAAMLEEWRSHLPIEFRPLPLQSGAHGVFKPIWINPAPFSVATQVHAAACILLALHRPFVGNHGDYQSFNAHQATMALHVGTICGLAMTQNDYASSIMSSQCVFIAGMCVRDARQQNTIVQLLETCRQRTGWPIKSLADDLRFMWNGQGQMPME